MKSILFLAIMPIETLFIFTYARIYGSLTAYRLLLIIVMAIVNLIISNIMINRIKDKPFVNETISSYERLDYESRKKLYSFKNGVIVTFLMALMPWILLFIGIAIVCYIFPHYKVL